MNLIRRLDTKPKLYLCFALLAALGAALAWLALDRVGVRSRTLLWAGVALQLVLGWGLARWLGAELERPLQEAAGMVRRIAAGDLSTPIATSAAGAPGMLFASLHDMNEHLLRVVARVREGAGALSGGAGALAGSAAQLAARGERHAAALHSIAQAIEALEAEAGPAQRAAIRQLVLEVADLEHEVLDGALAAQQCGEDAAGMRDQTGSLARLLRGFYLGPGHAQADPRIHLVSINRQPLVRSGRGRRKPAHIAAVTRAAPGALAGEEMNWQTF